MNKEYKPLGVAVFLVASGLLFSFLFLPKNGALEKKAVLDVSLFPKAHGAEIENDATLSVQGAPFLASPNAGIQPSVAAQPEDSLYGEGTLKDYDASPTPIVIKQQSTTATVKVYGAGMLYQSVIGDTLQSISTQFGISPSKLTASNPSVNFSSLVAGTPIVILGSGVSVN
jgi:LysM repeat protein